MYSCDVYKYLLKVRNIFCYYSNSHILNILYTKLITHHYINCIILHEITYTLIICNMFERDLNFVKLNPFTYKTLEKYLCNESHTLILFNFWIKTKLDEIPRYYNYNFCYYFKFFPVFHLKHFVIINDLVTYT